MKFAIVEVVNGHFTIAVEGFTDVDMAKVNYHGICQALWNASDVQTACVMIVDENLDTVLGYKEFISKTEPNA